MFKKKFGFLILILYQSRVQDVFNCTNPFCENRGKEKDADINAAMNIAHKEPIEDKEWDKMMEEEVLMEE